MNKSKKAMSTFVGLGSLVLFFALLLGVFAIVFSYVNNGQRNFYVRYGNEILAKEKKGVELDKSTSYFFSCGTLTGQTVDYEVQVLINVKSVENFDFIVDGYKKNFRVDMADYDCSALFALTKYETCFFLTPPPEMTLQQFIQAKYPDKAIEGVPDVVLQDKDSFILTVVDGVEKTKTEIYFC